MIVLCAAGCGGKSATPSHAAATSSPSRSTSTPAKTTAPAQISASGSKRFIAQADAICREANVRLARSKITTKKPEVIAAVVQQNQAVEQKAVDRLAKLKPPAALSQAWQEMLGDRRSLAQQLNTYATAVSLGVKSYGGLGASKKRLHARLREVGSKAGFRDCSKLG